MYTHIYMGYTLYTYVLYTDTYTLLYAMTWAGDVLSESLVIASNSTAYPNVQPHPHNP